MTTDESSVTRISCTLVPHRLHINSTTLTRAAWVYGNTLKSLRSSPQGLHDGGKQQAKGVQGNAMGTHLANTQEILTEKASIIMALVDVTSSFNPPLQQTSAFY